APGAMTVVFASPQEAAAWLLRALDVLPYLSWPAELLQNPMYEELAVDRAGRIVLRPAPLGWQPSSRVVVTNGISMAAPAATTQAASDVPDPATAATTMANPDAAVAAVASANGSTSANGSSPGATASSTTAQLPQCGFGLDASMAATAATAACLSGICRTTGDGSSLGGAETAGVDADVSCSDSEGFVLLQRGLRARAALAYGELGGELPRGGSLACQLSYKGRAWTLSRALLAKGKPGKVLTNDETASRLPQSLASRLLVV
ncbi:hypothetical protein Agub_g8725, partial [Astrephomene gubernaculifera]